MFKNTIKTILAAGIIASGATFASSTAANATSIGVHIGGHGGGIYIGNGHRRHGHRHRGHGRRHGFCKPRRALNKAWNMGVNRPHIARVGRDRIVVKGFNYGIVPR